MAMTIEWTDPDYAQVYKSDSKRNIIVNHNNLIVENIIYNCHYKTNCRCLVCLPSKTEAKEFHKYLRWRMNVYGDKWTVKDISAPYRHMEFSSGARVRMFAMDRAVMCGQDADFIYVQNTENISHQQISGAIIPVLQTTPDTEITFSFDSKNSENWRMLSSNPNFSIHDFSKDKEKEGMIYNEYTGGWVWL